MDDIQLTTWNDEDQFNLDTSRYQLKDSNHPQRHRILSSTVWWSYQLLWEHILPVRQDLIS